MGGNYRISWLKDVIGTEKQLLLKVPFGVNALWDGMKSLDLDMTLSGCIMGMTLHTRPEHIFRALVEASVFGAKKSLRPIVNMAL